MSPAPLLVTMVTNDLSGALLLIVGVLTATFLLPLLMALLEPDHDAEAVAPHRGRHRS